MTMRDEPAVAQEAPGLRGEGIDRAILAARDWMLRHQDPKGFWVDELEADSTLTSEYLLLRRYLGIPDPGKERKAIAYLRATQLPEGGWNIYHGGPTEISATVKAYFALKMAGVSPDEPWMRLARERILERGGITKVNVFTKILLALFDQYDWAGVPCMPVEIILFPRWFYFNLYEISYWSRTVLTPLLLIFAHRPTRPAPPHARLDELYPVPRAQADLGFPRDRRPLTWRNFFLVCDRILRAYDRRPLPALRRRALAEAHRWMVEHMRGEGGLGAIYPAMANSIVALTCLGYPLDHPLVQKALKEVEALEVEEGDSLHLQPCFSPVWDAALAINALLESGLAPDDPAIVRACEWLLTKQTRSTGDWVVKAPAAVPGGWPFQYENEFYPDVDDTAVAIMALRKAVLPDEEAKTRAIVRALDWTLQMECRRSGWAAFDVDSDRMVLNYIPFADHGALLDPPTCDVTARVVEALAYLGNGMDHPVVARAVAFLRRHQEPGGGWYGRWGVNYIYGTWSVLAALNAVGEDMTRPYISKAMAWLLERQNADGGWGESCHSYHDPRTAGRGESTPSQTAWALMALIHAGDVDHPAVARGVQFLLRRQRPDGAWDERDFTGTGFPRVFMLRYHMYRKYFPLWALALYRNRSASLHPRNCPRPGAATIPGRPKALRRGWPGLPSAPPNPGRAR